MKRLVVFDLDGTLAESKSMVDDEMVTLLYDLLRVAQVAVISGGDWPQFEAQMLSRLPQDERLRRLSMLPTCGTKFLRYEGAWRKEYSEDLSEVEKALITRALQDAVAQVAFKPDQVWGEQIEDRGSQITFSALGQQAPLAAKRDWDPDFNKRKQIQAILDGTLSEFSVRMGGTTSIDVTKVGIDKAYGIRKLREILGIEIAEMIFVGDALFPGGNDYPAKEAGVASIQVSGPGETKRVIEAIVACLDT
jgi:phosphomannomutase